MDRAPGTGNGRPPAALERPALPPAKWQPAVARHADVPGRLHEVVQPRPGELLLVHAGAGYGKTATLAATHRAGWAWYNVDRSDNTADQFAARLAGALGLDPPADPSRPGGEAAAFELANRLQGRPVTMTLDRYEHVADSVEIGRFLSELLVLAPAISIRVATRSRPALPVERLRLEGRLVEVGPGELRFRRHEIEDALARWWGRRPGRRELDFADGVLLGWPAALRLWHVDAGASGDLLAPLQPGQPLHEYLHEELYEALPPEVAEHLQRDWRWLFGRAPLFERASSRARRVVAERLVKDRIGVVPAPEGWRVHPLLAAFVETHVPTRRFLAGVRPSAAALERDESPQPGPVPGRAPAAETTLAIRTLGGLAVVVGGTPLADPAWPFAARRLLELLLSRPGHRASAAQAARMLWPHHPQPAARNSFNVALHGLRRALEPGLRTGGGSRYVVREGQVYRLCVERFACDVVELSDLLSGLPDELDEDAADRLETASGRYAGDFLPASTDDFARERRIELRAALIGGLQRLGAWHAAAGRHEAGLRAFRRILELDPDQDDAWTRALELTAER